MLHETLKWRSSYKPEALTFDATSSEAARGKLFILSHPDLEGRPVVFMRPRNEEKYNAENQEDRIKWLVYTLEMASRMADESCKFLLYCFCICVSLCFFGALILIYVLWLCAWGGQRRLPTLYTCTTTTTTAK